MPSERILRQTGPWAASVAPVPGPWSAVSPALSGVSKLAEKEAIDLIFVS